MGRRDRRRDRKQATCAPAGPAVALCALIALAPAEAFADEALVAYRVVDGGIPAPLTGQPGDAGRGRAIAAGREGNCLACHHLPIPEAEFHGDLGPDLADVGARLSEGALRLRLVDPKRISADSIMPAFYVTDRLTRVAPRYRGAPILTAAQIEDVVAYLKTLTGDAR